MAQAIDTSNTEIATGISGRLKAWWNGDEVPAAKAARSEAQAQANARQAESTEAEVFPSPSGVAEWTPQRIAANQRLFGDGIESPSAPARVKSLVNPIGLNQEMTVLNIGARLDVAARTIAKATGA